MGPQLGDICLGNAGPTEFRTEPLMGARHMRVYLHDGRFWVAPWAATKL